MEKLIINAFADEADSSIDGQIKAMLENGVEGLEIRGVDGQNVGDISFDKAREVREKLDKAGLKCWSVGSRLGKIGITDDFAPHLTEFSETLEKAKILGAKYIRLFSFYIPKDEAPEKYRDEVMKRLREFVKAAEGSGVILCHENEKGIYGDISERCLDIHETIPEIRCIFDPANYIQCGDDTLKGWDRLEKYIEYMHIKDALSDGSVVPAGKGEGHLPELISKFKLFGKGLTVEPHLKVFSGLSELENGEKSVVGKYEYKTSEEAFHAAVAALKEIM